PIVVFSLISSDQILFRMRVISAVHLQMTILISGFGFVDQYPAEIGITISFTDLGNLIGEEEEKNKIQFIQALGIHTNGQIDRLA
ncbi:hypothetical protein ACJX0J_034652, partial [Zea mays]